MHTTGGYAAACLLFAPMAGGKSPAIARTPRRSLAVTGALDRQIGLIRRQSGVAKAAVR